MHNLASAYSSVQTGAALCSTICYRNIDMPDLETLQMALIGYQAERRKIDGKIAEIQARLQGRPLAAPDGAAPARTRRQMSAAAKARIAAAQRKRWAKFRKQSGTATAPGQTAQKRVPQQVSSKRLEALAKARAARAAKRAKSAARSTAS